MIRAGVDMVINAEMNVRRHRKRFLSTPGSHDRARSNGRRARGIIAFFSVVLLAILSLVCMAFFSSTSLTLAQTSNQRAINDARIAAENGVAFMFYTIRQCVDITGASRGQMLFDSLKFNLEQALHDTANLDGETITVNAAKNKLILPQIYVGDNRWFVAEMEYVDYDVMRMTVTGFALNGKHLTISRKVSVDFMPQWEEALGYGITSAGMINLGNNTTVSGLRNPTDGSLYCGMTSGTAVSIGSGTVTGSINVPTTTAQVITGSTNVQGGVNRDVPQVTLPNIDLAPFLDAVPKDASGQPVFTVLGKNPAAGTYSNVKIPANTDPNFKSGVTINGVLYIEAPNVVQFSNSCTITGIVIGQKAANPSQTSGCELTFGNNATVVRPASELPDEYPFQEIRKLNNTAVIAPDFKLTFQNNMESASGMIAVRGLAVQNNGNTTINGSILVYGSIGVEFKNNATIGISLSTTSPPPGFKGHGLPPLMPVSSTYREW